MGAECSRHVTWTGLEVRDADRYARYRAEMAPLLALHGGRFEHDFEVARVLASSAGPRLNRLFALSFPDADARERFFADARYRRIRAEHFEPAVASRAELAVFTQALGENDEQPLAPRLSARSPSPCA